MVARSAPLIRLAVQRPGGEPRVVLIGLPNDDPASLGFEVRLLSLRFTDDEKKMDTVVLTVDNRNLDQLDGDLWELGNRIAFQFGYPGHMSPIRQATITCVKGFQVLTIEADADEIVMGRVQRTERLWEGVRRSDVARELAREYGFSEAQIFVEDSPYTVESITQAGSNDHQLLRRLALADGYEFYIDHDGFHFKARDLDATPIRVLTYFADPGVGDILSLEMETDRKIAKPGKISAAGKDATTGQSFLVTADNASNADRTALVPTAAAVGPDDEEGLAFDVKTGQQFTVKVPRVKSEGVAVVAPSNEKTRDHAQQSVDAAYRQNALKGATLTMKIIGDPTLFAKKLIRLKGAGLKLSGNWYVTSASHALTGDYTTTLKLGRDNLKGAAGTPVENVNDRDNSAFWSDVERGRPNNSAFWSGVEKGANNGEFWGSVELEPASIYDEFINETRTIMVPKGSVPKGPKRK